MKPLKEIHAMGSRRRESGLTLIELMVVITILGFLATIATIKVLDALEQGKRTKTLSDIDAYKSALKMYRIDNGRYPTTSQGLEALTESTDRHPEGYLETFNPNDAWDNPYEYTSDGRTFVIVSYGADGQEGGEGFDADISSEDSDQTRGGGG
jgi:general secretion pathway protein G